MPTMRTAARFYIITMLLMGAITFVAVLWCHLSHLRTFQGPELFGLWSTHGVHVFDIVVLVVELVLLTLLSIVLLAGFSRTS